MELKGAKIMVYNGPVLNLLALRCFIVGAFFNVIHIYVKVIIN